MNDKFVAAMALRCWSFFSKALSASMALSKSLFRMYFSARSISISDARSSWSGFKASMMRR